MMFARAVRSAVCMLALSSGLACSAPEPPAREPEACAPLRGTFQTTGKTDWVGPTKDHTATIFYVLRREAVAGATAFALASADNQLRLKILGRDGELAGYDLQAYCVRGHWTVDTKFSSYSDGATSRVHATDAYAVNSAGELEVTTATIGNTTAILVRKFDATTRTTFAPK